MKAKEISVYRIDEKGTIIPTSDGSKVIFNTQTGSYNGFVTSSGKSEKIWGVKYGRKKPSNKNHKT